MVLNKDKVKTVIIGAGLGGLIHGIMHKKARPGDEVIIYDLNKIPGGFCTAFQKAAAYKEEKIKYTVNIPLLVSDFGKDEPFDKFLNYLGVKNLNWKPVDKMFQYYPENAEPFLFTKAGAKDLIERSSKKERKKLENFFKKMKDFYNDIFHRAVVNPTPIQAIKMLLSMPASILTMLGDKPYLKMLDHIGIESPVIKEILSAAEAFMGVDVDKVSAVGEMLMIQSFLEHTAMQPTGGDNFQTLSDRLAERFVGLGGKLILNTPVERVLFDKRNACGVVVNGETVPADIVVIATAQDRIKELINGGKHIPKIKSLVNKIDKLPYPNSDFYCYYLIDKQTVDKYPKLTEVAYHVYKMKSGQDRCNWKLAAWVPDELYNNKYYVLALVMVEQDQVEVDRWMKLREDDYKLYNEEKEKMADKFLKDLQSVEPIFKEHPPLKHLMTFSPASYLPYGSKFPISGLAQVPENFGAKRMKPKLLNNLYISSGANFSAGVYGAICGGWQGFVSCYHDIFGVEIGNHDVIYKPGLKNLP